MKRWLHITIGLTYFICAIACGAQTPPSAVTPEPVVPLNRIVAIVNDEIITQSDLDAAINQLKQQLSANNVAFPPEDKLRDDALQQLIVYRLQLQMATRNDITPSSKEVDDTIAQIAASHKITLDQLQTQLAAQKISMSEFRKKIKEQIAISRLQQQMVAGQVKVTDADIADFKNSSQGAQEYHLIDFFFPLPDKPTAKEADATLAAARAVQTQLNNGADISLVKPAFQDLGWRTSDDLPEIFINVLPQLTNNNASSPLRAPNGYHVLKLIGTRNANQELTDDQIRNMVLRQKYEEAVKKAVERARNQAYIQIIPQ